MGSIVERVADVARDELGLLGFKKRGGAIFTLDLGDDVLGWLGFNGAAQHHELGAVTVHPIVGIRHQRVERLLAELIEAPFHSYNPPTVSVPMYTLVDRDRYLSWPITTTSLAMAAGAADLVSAIRTYGYPFLQANGSLDAVCRLLEEGVGIPSATTYRRPVAWLLAGDRERARASLSEGLTHLGARTDPAALHFRQFAERLHSRLEPHVSFSVAG